MESNNLLEHYICSLIYDIILCDFVEPCSEKLKLELILLILKEYNDYK